MKVKFTATCDFVGESATLAEDLQEELNKALRCLHLDLGDYRVDDIAVESAEKIPDPVPTEPFCPNCGSHNTSVIVLCSDPVWHCSDCKTDFTVQKDVKHE